MTATTTTQRYFGRCGAKGCKTRRIIDIAGYSVQYDGKWYGIADHEYGLRGHERRRFWEVMATLDLVCVEHDRFLRWTGLRATYNPDKECSAKCMNASRPACECSCAGENHGGGNLIQLS